MRPWQIFEPISASSRCVKVCCFESQLRLVWIYIQWFTQFDALFTLDTKPRSTSLFQTQCAKRALILSHSLFQTKNKITMLGWRWQSTGKVILLLLNYVRNARTVKLFQRYWLFGIQSFLELDECSLICQLQTNRSAFLGERFDHRNQILFALSFSANVSFRALLRPLYVTLCDTLCKASRYVK